MDNSCALPGELDELLATCCANVIDMHGTVVPQSILGEMRDFMHTTLEDCGIILDSHVTDEFLSEKLVCHGCAVIDDESFAEYTEAMLSDAEDHLSCAIEDNDDNDYGSDRGGEDEQYECDIVDDGPQFISIDTSDCFQTCNATHADENVVVCEDPDLSSVVIEKPKSPNTTPTNHRRDAVKNKNAKSRAKAIKKELEKRELLGSAFLKTPIASHADRLATLLRLRRAPQPEQQTDAWYEFRNSMLTASDFYKALGTARARNTFALQKVQVSPNTSGRSRACMHGIKYEPVCRAVYEAMRGVCVEEFGCIRHASYPFLGASPDGICDDMCADHVGRAVEFKAPISRKIVQGSVPRQYAIQVQGQLEVLGLDVCDYFECKIEECEETSFYKLDSSKHPFRGIVLSYMTDDDERRKIYRYSTPDMDNTALQRFVDGALDHTSDGICYCGHTFWYLADHNMVEIRRNTQWFEDTLLPALRETWDIVLKYRANPPTAHREGDRDGGKTVSAPTALT